jgi:hypothetical protein
VGSNPTLSAIVLGLFRIKILPMPRSSVVRRAATGQSQNTNFFRRKL